MSLPHAARLVDHLRRVPAFVCVGLLAGLAHWLLLMALVERAGLAPLLANLIAWAGAFMVSFTGHFRWTFADRPRAAWRGAMRFLAVSLVGLLVNEAAFAALLSMRLHYALAVLLAMALAAVSTYLLSASWAFRRAKAA